MGARLAKTPKRSTERRITDEELRSSIARFGCFLPVLRWGTRILDGHRRERIAKGVGKLAVVVELRTRREAASALWMVEPERTLTIFPEESLADAAELYGTTPAQVAVVRRALAPKGNPFPPERLPWHRRRSADLIPYQTEGKALLIHIRVTPELREAMRLARTERGHECTESAFVRRAIAAAIEKGRPDR